MPLTKLDEVAALIVIDLQKGIVSVPTVHPTSEISSVPQLSPAHSANINSPSSSSTSPVPLPDA